MDLKMASKIIGLTLICISGVAESASWSVNESIDEWTDEVVVSGYYSDRELGVWSIYCNGTVNMYHKPKHGRIIGTAYAIIRIDKNKVHEGIRLGESLNHWVYPLKQELSYKSINILDEMLIGKSMMVRYKDLEYEKGKISLKGFSDTYKKVSDACNAKNGEVSGG
ncbi:MULTISPECIES: hypothetical protein [unclassified Pseudoalteromonas]|uniref:hypothetical protein n=1 Tax=unclassified Pseudoalteromonas TaxID=194690 RepID=UPI0013FDA726|nr:MULTISPECIES: hypothetical protein [unclassified Pseudoalteromonas]MBH0015086.1 hypothetical protein [Pseudoalteromonas sp. NGC95]